ncbi:DNA gyrase subunit A [Lentzea waywayandensis]|uniref:DNA gyrase subunit A n=1 Tax=Lentzea waywayandensis TaxID=84724 RepID=A0A1I6DYD0_9PSEU|nr:hypothetical protein [Lentzea waywayandensis]SFR10540.1 DNA gyrase subunit A [Lentzea waywayandensis]
MSYPPGFVEERIQILHARMTAAESFVEVAAAISGVADENEAFSVLQERFGISELGARAVMEMQFRNLMPSERDKDRRQLEDAKEDL